MTPLLFIPSAAGAATPSFLSNLGVTVVLAAIPVILVAGTAFLKISIVLALVRSAVGAQDVPPTLVITALAAVLTAFVMTPVAEEAAASIETAAADTGGEVDPLGFHQAKRLLDAATPAFARFLKANTSATEIAFYQDLAGEGADENGLRILLPAFATTELVEAFMMGFLIFLPFLVVDLIVSTTLVSLGFNALSPTAVSLPLKLLLLTAVDGWHMILNGLLMGYGT